MRRFLLIFLALPHLLAAQTGLPARPKLVVGIMVDQMRWDFLYRFSERYGSGGFKRLLGEGFSCENAFIPYTPTYTAPGHACVYTGSVPALHGIAGNNWYSRELGRSVYCTEDDSVRTVGTATAAGRQSPRNMVASTITDELRLATNFRSKTIGLALKDRGSILPAGHSANGAFWFDPANGAWITSTYYADTLPRWMQALNSRKLPDEYLKKEWTPLFPLSSYVQSSPDDRPYENVLPGGDRTFGHGAAAGAAGRYNTFLHTPAANTFTLDAAKAAIEGEALGADAVTDFLALSFSAPDYIGHTFGPNSVEIEDTYLRLDRELAAFLTYLDSRIGRGQYLLFLTADHAVAHVPGFLREHRIPAGTEENAAIRSRIAAALQGEFGTGGLVSTVLNYQVYLNEDSIRARRLDRQAVRRSVVRALLQHPDIMQAFDLEGAAAVPLPEKVRRMVVNGYHQKRSGDIQFIYRPHWFEGRSLGTTHGTWNPYDSHIPLVWFGWKMPKGKLHREVYMTDIAPTLAALLGIQMPSASVGDVVEEVIRK